MWRLLLVLAGCAGAPSDKDTGDSDPTDSGPDDSGPDDSGPDDSGAVDADGDGYADDVDCDDHDETVNPGAVEDCDGVDDDCDGDTDEDAVDATTWYADGDGDEHGDEAVAERACEAPKGFVAEAGDCDDARSDVHPGAAEEDCADPTDYNCDGEVVYRDADGDGAAACLDCDDADASRSPALPELCDGAGLDEDCDGLVDDEDDSVSDPTTWYRDADGDGWGNASGASLTQCTHPAGYAEPVGDCDDVDGTVHPEALEVCDTWDVDEDCNGVADDDDAGTSAASWTVWYADRDGDGYGNDARSAAQCEPPDGYVDQGADCDDDDAERNPGAAEVCDAADRDEDCDDLADAMDPDVVDADLYYLDDDRDGYGTGIPVRACEPGVGYAAEDGDCDDDDDTVNPGAVEVCDAADRDEDCDGTADGADATGGGSWYLDEDGDGYGGERQSGCERPSGAVDVGGDCDDTAGDVNPGEVDSCGDGVDADCSGADTACPVDPYAGSYLVDEDASTMLYGLETYDAFGYEVAAGDFDGDGYGDVVASAPFADTPDDADAGVVYLYSRPLGRGEEQADTDPMAAYLNEVTTSWIYFGYRMANLGDLDGDGRDDLWMAQDSSAGVVLFGGDGGSLPVGPAEDLDASCASGTAAGAFDARSGSPDWACGTTSADSYRGAVYVFSGPTDTRPVVTASGEGTGDRAGRVAGGRDVDGDGYDDLWIGASLEDSAGSGRGAAYLVNGPATGSLGLADADVKVTGAADWDQLGETVALVPDTDGDGLAELAVSATQSSRGATYGGEVHLLSDLSPGVHSVDDVAEATFIGTSYLDTIGDDLAAGDINGDGRGDLVLTSLALDAGGSEAGGVWLLYGPIRGNYSMGTDADAEWLGIHAGQYLGSSVAIVPDADGDGDDELAMGAGTTELGGDPQVGAVWVWDGR